MTTATVASTTALASQLVPLLDTYTDNSTNAARIASYQRHNAVTANALEQLSPQSSNPITRTADRVRGCGHIQATTVCNKGHKVQVYRYQCGIYKLCPMCARRRSAELKGEVWPLIKHIEHKPVVGYRWRLITLTTNTNGQHQKAVELGLGAFTKLWRNMLKKPYAAAIRSLEFGPDTGNVHIHVLYYGPYVGKADLSVEWERLTGAPVVDIRQAGSGGGIGLRAAVEEVLKYVTNFTKVADKGLLVRCWKASKGRRLNQKYGLLLGRTSLECWLGVVLPKPPAFKVVDRDCCPVCGSTDLTTDIPIRGSPILFPMSFSA